MNVVTTMTCSKFHLQILESSLHLVHRVRRKIHAPLLTPHIFVGNMEVTVDLPRASALGARGSTGGVGKA